MGIYAQGEGSDPDAPWGPANEDFETPEDISVFDQDRMEDPWGVDQDHATPVKHIPAPDDSNHPWYEEYAEQLAKECPDPDCICKEDHDG